MEENQKMQRDNMCCSHVVRCIMAFFTVLVFLPVAAWADAPYPITWLNQQGSAASDSAAGVAADASGSLFVTGSTAGTLEEGKANVGPSDIFLAKFSAASGQKIWIKQLGMTGEDRATGVAVDGTGNVFVLGYVYVGSADSRDLLLVKFSATTGEILWVKQLFNAADESATGLAVDGSGNVFVAGSTDGILEQGKTNTALITDCFLAKFSAATGDMLWVKQFGTASYDTAAGVAVDASGSLFVSGGTSGALEEGTPNAGLEDVFLAKFSATGEQLWVKQLGSADQDRVAGVAADGTGGALVTGYSLGALEEGHANTGRDKNVFLARFSPAGEKLWVKQLVGSADATAVTLNGGGNVFMVAWGIALEDMKANSGDWDFFLAKFSAKGEKLWVKQQGSAALDSATGVAVDGSGNVFVTGSTRGALEEGKANAGDLDFFLARFSAPGALMAQIIADFDSGVSAGTITGSGSGNSADGRKNALRNMLLATQRLIAEGKTAEACQQLTDAYQKLDGVVPPPDFIQGPGVAAIATQIITLKSSFGCP